MGKKNKEADVGKDREVTLLDRKDRKIKTQDDIIKQLSQENENLKKEIEELKSDLEFEKSLPKGSIKKAKEMMEQMEYKKSQYEDLISDLEYMRNQYQEYLTELKELKTTYKSKLEESIKDVKEDIDITIDANKAAVKNKKLVGWEKGFFKRQTDK